MPRGEEPHPCDRLQRRCRRPPRTGRRQDSDVAGDVAAAHNTRVRPTMLIHQLPLDAAFATLRSAPPACRERTRRHDGSSSGPTASSALRRRLLAVRFLRQFTHFFAALLWVAALLALIADWSDAGSGNGDARGCDRRRDRDQRRLLVLAGVPRRRDDGRAAAPAAAPGQGAAGRDDRRARVRGRRPRRCDLSDRRGRRARRLPAGRRHLAFA